MSTVSGTFATRKRAPESLIIYAMLAQLTHFPTFKDLRTGDLKIVAPLFYVQTYPAGAVVIEQGEPARQLYLLTRGDVQVRYKPYDGEPITLNHIRSGGVFGWSAALGSKAYSSSIVCETECEMLTIEGEKLRQLLVEHPQTGRIVLDCLARAVSSRWVNAQAQIKEMLNNGIARHPYSFGKEGG